MSNLTLTVAVASEFCVGDKLCFNKKNFKVLSVSGTQLSLRPWRWYDSLAGFFSRIGSLLGVWP